MESNPENLAGLIERFTGADGVHATPVPRLSLIRTSHPTEPMTAVHEPALCILAQGRKQVLLADRAYVYDQDNYLIVSVDLPVTGQVIEATQQQPYLCIRIELDSSLLAGLIMDMGDIPMPQNRTERGLGLSRTTPELRDAATRLVGLIEHPRDIPILAPMIEREILYRLLAGEQSARLKQIALAESKLHQVNRAIRWIKANFAQQFRIEEVAAEARMSTSALHQHFRAVTAMSPLQYQKQLRLQEARRLILAHSLDAATAGHQVGYDSPSQFSREYARLFGAPPRRDVERLRSSGEIQFAA